MSLSTLQLRYLGNVISYISRLEEVATHQGRVPAILRPMRTLLLAYDGSENKTTAIAAALVCVFEKQPKKFERKVGCLFTRETESIVQACVYVPSEDPATEYQEMVDRVQAYGNIAVEVRVAIALADIAELELYSDSERADALARAEEWLSIGLKYLDPDTMLIKRLKQDIEIAAFAPQV